MSRREVPAGPPWGDRVGYARAVRVGSHVAVAGTTATGPDGEPVAPGDAGAQAAYALGRIEAALAELGAGLADVVRTRIYVTDIGQWEAVGRAHAAAFGATRPASTLVEVARLIDPRLVVEIEADALVSDALVRDERAPGPNLSARQASAPPTPPPVRRARRHRTSRSQGRGGSARGRRAARRAARPARR